MFHVEDQRVSPLSDKLESHLVNQISDGPSNSKSATDPSIMYPPIVSNIV